MDNFLGEAMDNVIDKTFREWPKIARLSRNCVITEKLDGTNASIAIFEDGEVRAGSRNGWITPEKDNFGFARWVKEHEEALKAHLGIGHHFGEWWGAGIQRRYGLAEKRFSLFDTRRWTTDPARIIPEKRVLVPEGLLRVVPVLYEGPFSTAVVDETLDRLRIFGSYAVPGFMKPEGVIVFHEASRVSFKKTIEKDEEPKGK